MAWTVTVTDSINEGGTLPGTILCYGTMVSDGGDSGGVAEFSTQGIRKILAWGLTCYSAEQAAQVVKSYDSATYDADILTVTTQVNATYNFWVRGVAAGA